MCPFQEVELIVAGGARYNKAAVHRKGFESDSLLTTTSYSSVRSSDCSVASRTLTSNVLFLQELFSRKPLSSMENPSPVTKLPAELLHRIFSMNSYHEERSGHSRALYTDAERSAKDDMLAYSQVSYAFRKNVLPLLFHTISIGINPELGGQGYSRPAGCTCRQQSELATLVDTLPDVLVHVRELRIRTRCHKCDTWDWDGENDPVRVVRGMELLSLLPKFVGLRALVMRDVYLSWGQATPPAVQVEPSLSLDSFSYALADDAFPDVELCDIKPLLASFTRVGRIHFADVTFYERYGIRHPAVLSRLRQPIEVTSLVIENCDQVDTLSSFLHSTSAIRSDTVRSVELGSFDDEECFGGVPALLGSFAAGLTRLALSVRGFFTYPPDCEHLLNHLQSYRSLASCIRGFD